MSIKRRHVKLNTVWHFYIFISPNRARRYLQLLCKKKNKVIKIAEATEIVLSHQLDLTKKQVPLEESIGCLLCEDLKADRDFPPFDRVTMDGIAIRYADFEKGQRQFKIAGLQAAGMPPLTMKDANQCIEIMTGAVLANGTDTIIRYEDLKIENAYAHIQVDQIKDGQNVHRKGTDRKNGDLIVQAGCLISPAEIGVAATIGKTQLSVLQLPRIIIISTGDELVEVAERPLPHQIRRSNVFSIQTAIDQYGTRSDTLHIDDDKEKIEETLKNCLEEYDVIIMSGAVSKGKFDYVPEVLSHLGVEQFFHKVAQRPGKPFWFGKSPSGTMVFALPGNPVSSFMCTHRYVIPWLRASLDLDAMNYKYAKLTSDFSFKPSLQYFLQVKISYHQNGEIWAEPIVGKGSGDLANLVDADGFLELPANKNNFNKGEVYPLLMYR